MDNLEPNMESSEASARNYSPFWPCMIVFLAILLANAFQLSLLIDQNRRLQTVRESTLQTTERVIAAETRIEGLAKDLMELARTNETAMKVVQDFNIQRVDQSDENEPASEQEN